MFNVMLTMYDAKRNLTPAQFVIYRYVKPIDAHYAAKEFNETPGVHRPPSIQRIIDDVQYLYPETKFTITATVEGSDK